MSAERQRGSREITLELAQEGMLLAQPLSDASGAVLLAQGASLTDANLAALRRRGVERCSVVAEDEAELDPAAQANAERERERQLARLQRLFRATPPGEPGAQLQALLQRYRQGGGA